MEQWERKKAAVIIVLVLVLSGISVWLSRPSRLEEGVLADGERLALPSPGGITVYVSGAVVNPGLYEVPADSRAKDAIAIAGGITSEANVEKVNLARKCKDGMQINVPALSRKRAALKTAGGQSTGGGTGAETGIRAEGILRINLNNASTAELEELPGIGPATAAKIIDYRSRQRFEKIEDIMKVKGIGKAKFDKMKEFLEV